MRECFESPKHKLGVITLVVACVTTAGWARNVIVQDVLRGGPGNVEVLIVSSDRILSIGIGPDDPKPKVIWTTR